MAAIEDRRTRTAPTSSLIAQRYELGQPLAHGGMATLWRGWDRRLCRPVAIKTLREDDFFDESLRTRLRREALVSAALSHPHIVEVHDLVEEEGRPYLIMELVEGEDLKRRIVQRGALDPLDALEIARQICLALEASHVRGVIHRDVKPHNILLTVGRRAKLTDFGLALSPLDTIPEHADVVFGTPEYMAPEQAMGEQITAATDLYGLGVTLYEALSGDAPFQTPSAEETMKQHISTPITPLRALRPELPRCIEDVVMRALEKEPGRRFAGAQQMEQALLQASYDARDQRAVFAAPAWPAASDAAYAGGAALAAPYASQATRLPDALWVRLMWVVFALNIILAISLLCAFVLHLAM
jgi:eukaryotic-like serine/threonine-protein kinase